MAIKSITHGVYVIALGAVNVFLLESNDGLVLIDTGTPGSADKILRAVQDLGKQLNNLRHILLTHWHPDHTGSLAALKRATSALTYAHPIDAPLIREGGDLDPRSGVPRPFPPAPGLITRILYRLFIKPYPGIEGAAIDHEINEGDTLPFLPDLQVIFTPGHSDGHLAFLLEAGDGVLFAGDACANLPRLGWSLGYENLEEGKRSLKKMCGYDFQIATFGHGGAIVKGAAAKWRKKWGNL